MQIGMVNGYVGIQNYRMPNITKVDDIQPSQNITTKEQPETQSIENVTQPIENRKPVIADLENISIGFNKQDDYSYIGKDVDIEQLDMQKAISDMKKDSLFHQYQFFVRSAMMG